MDIKKLSEDVQNSSIYIDLGKNISDLRLAEVVDYCGIDSLFDKQASLDMAKDRIKISSMSDISDFFRLSKDTLVNKAKKDLWRIIESNGEIIIERLFDPNGQPLRI